MKLTDTAIRKAKSADKAIRIFDGGGLYIEIPITGSKRWRFKYRFDGKERLLSLGTYPEVNLADARKRHAQARALLAEGIDPGEQRKATKAARAESAANSFEAIAGELLAMRATKLASGTASRERRLLDKDLALYIGSKPIADVRAPELWQHCARSNAGARFIPFFIKKGGCSRLAAMPVYYKQDKSL